MGIPHAADMNGEPLVGLATGEATLATAQPPVGTYATGFRPATAPRVPKDGLNEDFERSFLDQLGYSEAAEEQAARDQEEGGD